jgi:pantetheine-phosphate adenylyltransferase
MQKTQPKKVVVGGTFDVLHKGHKVLLREAFELGEVAIGLTSDKMAREMKNREVQSFEERKKELESFIREEFKTELEIVKIEDEFGFTLEADFDYIIVSPETYQKAEIINQEREKRNRKPIEIMKIDFVLAEDGNPISSTRILQGEIDREGKLLE